MIKYNLKLILLILILPLLANCAGTLNYNNVPTGYKTLDKASLLKNDGFNKVFIMEEGMETFNSWNTGNDYFVDGQYIGKLAYGIALPHKTKKNKINLVVANSFFCGKITTCPTGRQNIKYLGGRSIEIDFSQNKEHYLISYTDETNFSIGGSLIGMLAAQKRLKSTGEPFKFREVSKDVWWKMHDDLNGRGINKKWSPMQRYQDSDLQQARDLQGVSP